MRFNYSILFVADCNGANTNDIFVPNQQEHQSAEVLKQKLLSLIIAKANKMREAEECLRKYVLMKQTYETLQTQTYFQEYAVENNVTNDVTEMSSQNVLPSTLEDSNEEPSAKRQKL